LQIFYNGTGTVRRTVVNDQQMEIMRQGKNLPDHFFHIFFFVVSGDYDK